MGIRILIAVLVVQATSANATKPDRIIADVPLTEAFATRTPWHLIVKQSAIAGESGTGDAEPGVVTPYLHNTPRGGCNPALSDVLSADTPGELPHFLNAARIGYRLAGQRWPLLIVVTAGVHAGNGSQLVRTQALGYRTDLDRFVRLFDKTTGTNNNQEVRFIAAGPLRGAFVTAEPTGDAPFGYWITVSRSSGAATGYRIVLRYRSATHYGDGNTLPVIDSEMPQILRRLELWRPGQGLPLPTTPCPKPTFAKGELWCR